MQGSKISLSPAEAALICNAEVILTKNSIIQKTVALLSGIQKEVSNNNLSWKMVTAPKISKGENYQGLPYVVLDYPRIAENENLFFIRTMFWWGKFFSSTLQVAGTHKEKAIPALLASFEHLQEEHYIGINNDPWQHHFEPDNYKKIAGISREEFTVILQKQSHIKIAARWSLDNWDMAANHLTKSWQYFAGLVP